MAEEDNPNPQKIDLVPYNQETAQSQGITPYTEAEQDKEKARMFKSIYGADQPVLSPKYRMILTILAIVLISIVLFIAFFLFKGVEDLL